MEDLFLCLFLICCIAFIVGLIKPKWVIHFGKRNRKQVCLVYFLGGFISLIALGATCPPVTKKAATTSSKEVKKEKKEVKRDEKEQVKDDKPKDEPKKEKIENDKPKEEVKKEEKPEDITKHYVGTCKYAKIYAKNNNIKLESLKSYEKVMPKLNELFNTPKEKYVFIAKENEMFGTDYFRRTKDPSDYVYIGDLKDNKPNGLGILFNCVEFTDDKIPFIQYAGYFKDGYYNGYGQQYNIPEGNIKLVLSNTKNQCPDKSDMAQAFLNHIKYDGEFEKGVPKGKGNVYSYPLYERIKILNEGDENELIQHKAVVDISLGELNDGKMNGKCKEYSDGKLSYEGEMYDDEHDGNGIEYFENGKVKYKGNYKYGKYDGKGTLYNEDGSVQYSGKWENGDYASN